MERKSAFGKLRNFLRTSLKTAHGLTAQKRITKEGPILDAPGVARAGDKVRGLETAQLRRTAQNEIHRREYKHGEHEAREVRAIGNCYPVCSWSSW